MPTYDYECENGHRFEVFQSMKDDPLTACSECGAPVRRVIGPGAGFLFKGGGFYITEYRSKEYKEKAKSEAGGSGSSESSGGKSDKSSDKPATKSPGGESSGSKPSSGSDGGDKGGGSKSS